MTITRILSNDQVDLYLRAWMEYHDRCNSKINKNEFCTIVLKECDESICVGMVRLRSLMKIKSKEQLQYDYEKKFLRGTK